MTTRKPRLESKAKASNIPSARRTPLPRKLAPQLATLQKRPPTGDEWIFEAKLDGYRILARIDSGKVRLFTRNGNDWTAKMPALARDASACAGLSFECCSAL